MIKSFAVFPSLMLASAALLAAAPHHTARKAIAHKAEAADTITAYLAKCQTSESECAIGVSEARAAYPVTQAMFHDPDYCVSAADDDSHALAPKVTAWLKDHPDHNPDPIYTGINAALLAMYPCAK
jgi:hypothetical protein